jgi:hypothetical protein
MQIKTIVSLALLCTWTTSGHCQQPDAGAGDDHSTADGRTVLASDSSGPARSAEQSRQTPRTEDLADNVSVMPFPSDVRDLIDSTPWVFAKTYAATWPHEYIVRERVDENLFLRLVTHIRTYGYEGRFYHQTITYFDEDDLVYWTMGAPIADTIIVNRCRKDQTYAYRLAHDLLPEQETEEPDTGRDDSLPPPD